MKRKVVGDVALLALAAVAVVAAAAVMRQRRSAELAPVALQSFARIPVSSASDLAGSGNILGSATAPTKLVEFSDFQCPFCRRFQSTMEQFQSRHPKDVAVVYRQFPLRIHAFARDAAVASECAATEKEFPAFANLLFAKQDSLGLLSWATFAVRAGIQDTARFHECLTSARVAAQVDTDIAVGTRLGITGTPAIVIGKEMIIGAVPLDTLETLVAQLQHGASSAPNGVESRTAPGEAPAPFSH